MNSYDKNGKTAQSVVEQGAVSTLVDALNNSSQASFDSNLLSVPSITAVLDTEGAAQIVHDGGSMDDPTPQFRGRGEPGTVVTIYDNGQVLGQALVDKAGGWSLQLLFDARLEPGEHVFTVANETGEVSEPFRVTVTAIDAITPVIESVYDDVGETGIVINGGTTDDNTPTFTGKGESGTRVFLYDGNEVIATTLVGADGVWSIDTEQLSSGQHVFAIGDSRGERSEPFVLNVIGVPEVPSAKLVIDSVYDNVGQTGVIGNGGITDDNTPAFTGKGEPGTRVNLFEGSTYLASAIVDANGRWTIDGQVQLSPGQHVLTLVGSDGTRSEPFVLSVIGPMVSLTIDSAYDNVGQTGVIGNGGSTDDNTPAFTGKGEPGTRVNLFEGSTRLASAIVDANGSWTIDGQVQLSPGQHVLTLVGNDGRGSEPFVLNVTGPTVSLTIDSVYDNVGQTGVIGNGGSTDDNIPAFTGKGEPGTRVNLFEGSTYLASAIVDANGSWTIDGQVLLSPGQHVLTLVGSDGARSEPFVLNVTGPTVSLTIDSVYDNVGQTGVIGNGGSTDDNTPDFAGKGEPGTRVYLFEGSTRLASAIVDANGNWTIDGQVQLSPGQHVLTLVGNDGRGSEPFMLNVTENKGSKPVIESAMDNIGADIGLIGNGAITDDERPTLKGHGEPNTTVSLYVDGRFMVRAEVAEDGSWSLLSPRALTPGEHVFTVLSNGVMSDPFVLTVADAPPAATLAIESAFDQTGPITGVIGEGGTTDEHQPVFQGRGEPDAPVFLFVEVAWGRLPIGSGVVQADGTWEVGVEHHIALASGQNVFSVSDGVRDSASFTLHIGVDPSAVVTAAQANDASDMVFSTLSLSDLLQDTAGELFANEVALPPINDEHLLLDMSVVEAEGGMSVAVAVSNLMMESELSYTA